VIRFLTEPYAAAGKPESCAVNKSTHLSSVLYHPLFSIPHLFFNSAFMISSTSLSLTSFYSSFYKSANMSLHSKFKLSISLSFFLSLSFFKGLLSCFSKESWKKIAHLKGHSCTHTHTHTHTHI